MSRAHTPCYGRFAFPGIGPLIQRLEGVSSQFLGGTPFSAYLATTGHNYYGLTLSEVAEAYPHLSAGLTALSASAHHTGGQVARVHVRFHGGGLGAQGQFILAGGAPGRLHKIAALLQGTEVPPLPDDTPPVILAPAEGYVPPRQAPIRRPAPGRAWRYRQPTLSLTDYFYVDPVAGPDVFIDLVNTLSERFLEGVGFHVRLETTDGDYHLHLDRAALRYMFQQRRDKLLMLYLDAATLDGQWVNLRFSYHPLAAGPNAEVDITSHRAEDILEYLRETMGVPPPVSPLPARLNEAFAFDPAAFDLGAVMGVVQALSRHHLQGIPPVAFLAARHGASYTGLSLYQLGRIFARHRQDLAILSFGIAQISTGQTLSLMFQFPAEAGPGQGSLSIMWGQPAVHAAIRADVLARLPLRPQPPRPRPRWALRTCLVSLPWGARWTPQLWECLRDTLATQGVEAITARALYAHQQWDNTMIALTTADLLVADLSYKQPDVLYQVGLAQAQGTPVLILAQDQQAIPGEFRDTPRLRYQLSPAGLSQLAQDLPGALQEWA